MTTRVPLPDGVDLSLGEKLYRNISLWLSEEARQKIWEWVQWGDQFLQEFGSWLFAASLCIAILFLVLHFVRRQQKRIEKIWNLLLFFLSKRQMILPLVYTFAQRDNLLEASQLKEILRIRSLSQSVPFRKDPSRRIEVEATLSRILFSFFSHIENQPHHPSQKIIKSMSEDFEFIDEKLVQLQQLYNREALKWNHKRNRFPLILFAWIFRFPSFRLFKPPSQ